MRILRAKSERTQKPTAPTHDGVDGYVLEKQIGHLLRRAHQRASAIFAANIGEHRLTPVQFAALAKIYDAGAVSQNKLGRQTAMDPATMQGVISRLAHRGYIERHADPKDRRRTMLRLTPAGETAVLYSIPRGKKITRDTLAPLTKSERDVLLKLLSKLG
ncbi:MAG: MarR family winged helix-turn-helix transcriptional regulator [Alphaproteobacteria bacterium]